MQIQRLTNQSLPGSEKPIKRKQEEYESYKVKNIRSGWKRKRNQPEASCILIANQKTGRRIRIQLEEGWRLTANQKRGDRILIQSDRQFRRKETKHASNQRTANSSFRRKGWNTVPIRGLCWLSIANQGRGWEQGHTGPGIMRTNSE
jgi:hypothetical protein